MSLEMAHKVIVPPKKNYIPQFLKQRDINSYFYFRSEAFYFTSGKTSKLSTLLQVRHVSFLIYFRSDI
jgi:hypothetical protein